MKVANTQLSDGPSVRSRPVALVGSPSVPRVVGIGHETVTRDLSQD